MSDLQDDLRSWCIGRHLINLPSSFAMVDSWGVIRGLTPERLPDPATALEDVAKRRAALLQSGQARQGDTPLVFVDQTAPAPGRIRLRSKDDLSSLGVEAEDWNEELFVATKEALFRLETVVSDATKDAVRADMEAVASTLSARAEQDVPQGQGACIKEGYVALPSGTESFGASFAGPPDERPMGFDITIISRAAEDPPYEGSSSIKPGFGTGIDIAGLPGRYLTIEDEQRFFVAIAGEAGGGGKTGTEIMVEFYDQRADRNTTYDKAWAGAMWLTVLDSIRPKR